jgi:hypothetical protein
VGTRVGLEVVEKRQILSLPKIKPSHCYLRAPAWQRTQPKNALPHCWAVAIVTEPNGLAPKKTPRSIATARRCLATHTRTHIHNFAFIYIEDFCASLVKLDILPHFELRRAMCNPRAAGCTLFVQPTFHYSLQSKCLSLHCGSEHRNMP